MSVGLFGKLPVKRDFVAVNVSRRFLEMYEIWLQTGLATSKLTLGGRWGETYNRAPLWRFWLGADLCGEPVIGAFTPSVDGVGRAFPLTILATAEDGALPPPELESNDSWFEAAEQRLIDALDPAADFDGFVGSLASLPAPKSHVEGGELGGLSALDEGGALARDVGDSFSLAFRAALRFDQRRAFAALSFWWTVGGEGFEPMALALRGMPPATRFSDFLTGAFAPEVAGPA
jgi:type VI secretion system protein ImpM